MENTSIVPVMDVNNNHHDCYGGMWFLWIFVIIALMGGFGGNAQLFIKCPKGTKGTYIADWCANPAEKEFLIAPNQKMIVRKIEKEMVWDEPHYKVFVDIITGG